MNGSISSTTAASGSIVKNGAGTLRFSDTTANTYTGLTTVNAGELDLNKSAGILAIAGGLIVGDGIGGANSDIVKLLANGQIATTAAVFIHGSSGKLDLNGFTQTLGSLADTGTGAQTLSGLNTFTGGTTITGGTLGDDQSRDGEFIRAGNAAADERHAAPRRCE